MAVGIIGGPIGGPIGGVINTTGASTVDANGSANIDFSVSGVAAAFADAVGSANIDFSISSVAAANADGVGSANIDFSCSGVTAANADAVGNANVDFACSGASAAFADSVGSANVDVSCSGVAAANADAVGSANIDFSVSGAADAFADASSSINIDFNVSGITPPPEVEVPPVPKPQDASGGVGRHAWRDHYKRLPKKKRKLLENLDEALVELRSRIEEVPPPDPAIGWVRQLRRLEQFVDHAAMTRRFADEVAKAHLETAKALMREIDDEEATFLLLH